RNQPAGRPLARPARPEAAPLMAAQATRQQPAGTANVLEVDGLSTVFSLGEHTVNAVDDVSLSLDARETLAVVGESGCGKSTTALSIMRLVPHPPGKIVAREGRLGGRGLPAPAQAQEGGRGGDRNPPLFPATVAPPN